MKIKLTENQLNKLIVESTKKILNEISWQRAQDAAKMAEDNDCFDMVLSKLEEALYEFDEAFDRYNSDSYAGGKIQRNSGSMKYFDATAKIREFRERLQELYDDISSYHERKINQQANLEQMADEKFKESHNGVSYRDYDNSLPDDDLTPEQQEFSKYEYGR